MNLRKKLSLKKEIYFLKYIMGLPIYLFGKLIFKIFKTPKLWLVLEVLLFVILLFKKPIIYFFQNFPLAWDKSLTSLLILMALTAVYTAWSSQNFQEEYRKEEERRIRKEV